MTYQFEALSLTIDARWWTHAGETGAVGFGVGALEAMVFGQMVASAKWADDGVLRATTVLDVVAERMAAVALFN